MLGIVTRPQPMSKVTNVILLTATDESGVARVQQWLHDKGCPALHEIGKHAGGYKVLQCEVWAAAFNYFDIDGFSEEVNKIQWGEPVHLLINDEEDEHFTMTTPIYKADA